MNMSIVIRPGHFMPMELNDFTVCVTEMAKEGF